MAPLSRGRGGQVSLRSSASPSSSPGFVPSRHGSDGDVRRGTSRRSHRRAGLSAGSRGRDVEGTGVEHRPHASRSRCPRIGHLEAGPAVEGRPAPGHLRLEPVRVRHEPDAPRHVPRRSIATNPIGTRPADPVVGVASWVRAVRKMLAEWIVGIRIGRVNRIASPSVGGDPVGELGPTGSVRPSRGRSSPATRSTAPAGSRRRSPSPARRAAGCGRRRAAPADVGRIRRRTRSAARSPARVTVDQVADLHTGDRDADLVIGVVPASRRSRWRTAHRARRAPSRRPGSPATFPGSGPGVEHRCGGTGSRLCPTHAPAGWVGQRRSTGWQPAAA